MDPTYFFALQLFLHLIILQSAAKLDGLEECLLELVQKYQHMHVLCIAEYGSYELDFLLKLTQPRWLYFNKYNRYFTPPRDQIDVVILLSQDSATVDNALGSIKNFFFKSDAVLFIINSEMEKEIPQKLLYVAWKYDFRNSIVLQKHNLEVYSYAPVLSGYCTDVKTTSLGACPNVNYLYDPNVDVFNCTVRIGALEPYFYGNGGFEAEILKIVTKKLGLHVEYTLGTTRVLVPMLEKLKLDLLAGELMPDGDPSRIVVHYSENEMALFVPIAKTLPPWKNAVHIYDLETWTCLLASIVAFTTVWHIAPYNNRTSLLYIVCSLISSLPKRPTTLKPLFALWMIFALIITNAFSGLLISFIFKPLHNRQMSSLKDIIAQNWSIYDNTWYPYFINETNIEILGDRHTFCEDVLFCFNQLSYDKSAYASPLRHFNYMAESHGNIDVYKFNSLKMYLVFWSCERSKYKIKIQNVTSRIFEVGLVQHLDIYNYNPLKTILDKHFKPLVLKHLYLIFGAYFAGLFVASFAFLHELWRFK